MITAGVDCGAKNTKVVVMKDGVIVGKASVLSGFDQQASAEEAYNLALQQAGLSRSDVQHVTATGMGKHEVTFANDTITDVGAASKGANYFFPSCRTVIDVGAEEGRALKCDAQGRLIDFAVNERCAAGAGSFTESMARALELKLEDMGPLSLQATRKVPMNSQCAVFSESEVVSLVHAKTPKADIARAVHDAISSRITSMARRVGLEKDVCLIGGVANNVGFVKSLTDDLQMEVLIPADPAMVGAVGAALAAAEKAQG